VALLGVVVEPPISRMTPTCTLATWLVTTETLTVLRQQRPQQTVRLFEQLRARALQPRQHVLCTPEATGGEG
jgi:hypothetical protein